MKMQNEQTLDWQVVDDDELWEKLSTAADRLPISVDKPQGYTRKIWQILLASLVLWFLITNSSSFDVWQASDNQAKQSSADISNGARVDAQSRMQKESTSAPNDDKIAALLTVEMGEASFQEWLQRNPSWLRQRAADKTVMDSVINLSSAEFGDSTALLEVVVTERRRSGVEASFRETRFYRQHGEHWKLAAPNASFWGPKRTLETPSLRFRFHDKDKALVTALAPRLEISYTAMRQNFGLTRHREKEKLKIDISLTEQSWRKVMQSDADQTLTVSSPAIRRRPVELSDTDLLYESVVHLLLEEAMRETTQIYEIDHNWILMVDALRLWQLWESNGMLSSWREEIVTWFLAGSEDDPVVNEPHLLPQYEQLCAMHRAWGIMPALYGALLTCTEHDQFMLQSGLATPHSFDLSGPILEQTAPNDESHYRGQTIVLETLLEYVVATYGVEQIPRLLSAFGQHEWWETLIPAVFDVTADEFKEGWQTYLAETYSYRSGS